MANKVYNMDGGLHSSAALGALEDAMYGSSVASSSSFVCSAGTGMNVNISTGDGLISTGTGFARRIGTDAVNTVAISAASTASPRIDSIVAYIDNSVTPTETVLNNTNGILNFKAVTGTAAANPVAPSANTVQSSVGAGNPYMVLYNVRVPANATSLTSATFTDMRNIANIVGNADIADNSVTAAKIVNSTITASKINWTTIGPDYANKQAISSNSFTSTTFGWLLMNAVISSNTYGSTAVARIDGVNVWSASNNIQNQNAYNTQFTGMVPIAAGSTATFEVTNSASWGSRYFVPAKS